MSEPKIALVTGASRGIGRAIAIRLAEAGFKVVGTATSLEGVKAIESALKEFPWPGRGLVLDVTVSDSLSDFKKTLGDIGPIAVLVNNAGIAPNSLLMRMKYDEWMRVMDTNLHALYHMTHACLKPMIKERWGRIVNISSILSSIGNVGQTHYAASKAGVEGFTRALAREVAPWNITVNAVAPGLIETDMTEMLIKEHSESLMQGIPLRRFGQAKDVAHVVNFLCSEESGYVTGQTIHVNGGRYMT